MSHETLTIKNLKRYLRSKQPVTSSFIVPPETAVYILENHNVRATDLDDDEGSDGPTNRTLKSQVVAKYAKDMGEGEWQHTHQGLAFDTNKYLSDGQHRCEACVKAGKPFQTEITFGQDPKARQVVDQGTVRTPADALQLDPEVKHKTPGKCKYLASVIQTIAHLGHAARLHRSRQSTMSVISEYKADKAGYDFVMEHSYRTGDAKRYFTPEMGAAVYRAFRGHPRVAKSVLVEFCSQIQSGDTSSGATTWTRLIDVQKSKTLLPHKKPFYREGDHPTIELRSQEVPRQLLLAAEKAIHEFYKATPSRRINDETAFLTLRFLKELSTNGLFFLDFERE